MAARSISWISRLSLISIVVWLARPMRARSRSGSKPGLAAWANCRGSTSAATSPRMNAQTTLRLLAVAHAEVVAAGVGEGLGGGGLRLLVVVLAVDDGGEAVARVLVDVLPDVEHAAAGGVHEHAAPAAQLLHLRHRHPEGGQDDDVAGRHLARSATPRPSPRAGCGSPCPRCRRFTSGLWMISPDRKIAPIRELLPGLVGVLDRAVHAVAEPELPGQLQGQVAGPGRVAQGAQPVHHRARVVLGQHGADRRLEAEPLLEVRLAHYQEDTRPHPGRTNRPRFDGRRGRQLPCAGRRGRWPSTAAASD